jgi:hypothetical protein
MNSPFLMVLYALLAGFAAITLLTFAHTKFLMRTIPAWAGVRASSTPGAVVVNLGFTFLAGAAGGYIAAWIAADNPMAGVLALAIVVLVMGAIGALERRGKLSLWFVLMMVALSPASVVVGGLLRLKFIGVSWAGF